MDCLTSMVCFVSSSVVLSEAKNLQRVSSASDRVSHIRCLGWDSLKSPAPLYVSDLRERTELLAPTARPPGRLVPGDGQLFFEELLLVQAGVEVPQRQQLLMRA